MLAAAFFATLFSHEEIEILPYRLRRSGGGNACGARRREGCEYPVLRDTLAGMDLSGAIVSTDALSCQNGTAQTAVIDVQTAGFTLIVR